MKVFENKYVLACRDYYLLQCNGNTQLTHAPSYYFRIDHVAVIAAVRPAIHIGRMIAAGRRGGRHDLCWERNGYRDAPPEREC